MDAASALHRTIGEGSGDRVAMWICSKSISQTFVGLAPGLGIHDKYAAVEERSGGYEIGRHLGGGGGSIRLNPFKIRSVAMLIAISAIVPSIFVVIPMVIAIIVAFAWPNHATRNEANKSQ
jgi:hypothetical protein